MSPQELLKEWHPILKKLQFEHSLSSRHYEKQNKWMGGTAAVISAVLGTAIFASLNQAPELWAKALAAALSVISAILVAMQTFFSPADQSEKHKTARGRYRGLVKSIDEILVFPSPTDDELRTFVVNLRKEWDAIDS